jgi:uncharacterized membrane protein
LINNRPHHERGGPGTERPHGMEKGRLEAFSDGVVAILITILVLEFRVPDGASWGALGPMLPTFLTYVLSFVFIGIYWNNHHHMLQLTTRINGRILWANLHLLFWLSLVPFVTAWMAKTRLSPAPTALYGVVLLMAGVAYTILQMAIIAEQGGRAESPLYAAVKSDVKGKLSVVLYGAAILVALVRPPIAAALYVAVALMWFIPDPRIESRLQG